MVCHALQIITGEERVRHRHRREVTAESARDEFDDMVERVSRGECLLITRASRPVCAMIPIDAYHRLVGELERWGDG